MLPVVVGVHFFDKSARLKNMFEFLQRRSHPWGEKTAANHEGAPTNQEGASTSHDGRPPIRGGIPPIMKEGFHQSGGTNK